MSEVGDVQTGAKYVRRHAFLIWYYLGNASDRAQLAVRPGNIKLDRMSLFSRKTVS
jgi:hypothetical protein